MINVGDTVHVTDDALKMNGGKHRKEFKVTKISRDSFGNQWIHGDAPFEIWNATELEECTLKYKVGDKVIIAPHNKLFKNYAGVTGVITKVNAASHGGQVGYLVGHGPFVWEEPELKLVPPSTVTITFTGDTTTATDGEHTATVTKYYGDEYSEETGAVEAIKKLYHRFPQKGDVVYFVNTGYGKVYTGSCIFDDTHEIDRLYRKSGNLYETREAAQAVADKINAIFKEEH